MNGNEVIGLWIILVAIAIAYRVLRTRHIGGDLPSIPEIAGILFYWWARMWYCHLVAYDEYLHRYREEKRSFTIDQKVILVASGKEAEASAE